MGSKPKVWLEAQDGVRWLFKERHRPQTGDDWSEKVAAEVADALGIPHATVELARRDGKRGIITRDLVNEQDASELVLGNSLLVQLDPDYPTENRYHVVEHTVDRVYAILDQPFMELPRGTPNTPALQSSSDVFTGYLMLDALLGNTDRHHENWAILQMAPHEADRRAILCPSFDHASCLGHNLLDTERHERMSSRDRNRTVAAFVRSAKLRSALYRDPADDKPLSPRNAFLTAAQRCPEAASYWLKCLAGVPIARLTDIVNGVPDEIMTDVCRRFVSDVLSENRANLLSGNV